MRARLIGLFHVELPRTVLLIQAGSVVNSFGFGVVLPFEIYYLHYIRHFALTTSGLILATVMATATVVAAPVGTLLDHVTPKTVLLVASIFSGAAYGALAFVDRPWQGFVCSAAAGIGLGSAQSAGAPLMLSFLTPEQQPTAFALQRVALNLGIGAGALVAGLVVGANGHLRGFQTIYLLDAASYCAFFFVLLVAIPASVRAKGEEFPHGGFRQVLRHRGFVLLLLANVLLVVVGYALFGNLLGAYAKADTNVSPRVIGLFFLVNTVFIVIAQLPAREAAERLRRHHALALMAGIWALACLAVVPTSRIASPAGIALLLVAVSIMFGIGECFHAVVLAPTIVDLAPPPLLARYMALFGLTFTLGLALGPSVGAAILAASPSALWLAGGVTAAVVGVGFLTVGRSLDPKRVVADVMPLAAAE